MRTVGISLAGVPDHDLHKLRKADVPVVILVDIRHQLLDGLLAHPHPLPELEHFRELRHGEVPRGVHVEGGEELKVLLDLFVLGAARLSAA